MTWLPSYLEHKYGLNLQAVGLFTVLPWLAAAFLLWLFGRWSDHLLAHPPGACASRART